MANAVAGGMKSLSVLSEQPGANNDAIARAWEAVLDVKMREVDEPKFEDTPVGDISLRDLPLAPIAERGCTAKHAVEVIVNYAGPVDKARH